MSARLNVYLGVADGDAALAFYTEAFGATEQYRLVGPDGSIMHAEMDLADTTLMLAQVTNAPAEGGELPFKLVLDVADCDAATERAVGAGATLLRQPEDQFHGHRQAVVRCPYGYAWFLSERREDLDSDEIQRRFGALFAS
ncbi:MAG: VOC family protein [Pseudomonadota bacterium]